MKRAVTLLLASIVVGTMLNVAVAAACAYFAVGGWLAGHAPTSAETQEAWTSFGDPTWPPAVPPMAHAQRLRALGYSEVDLITYDPSPPEMALLVGEAGLPWTS